MFSKRKKEEEYVKCCLNCEFASLKDRDDPYPDTVYCEKHRKEKESDQRCRSYAYDLLKRSPAQHAEIPTLDPELLEL
ncbi:MAG: hypothetical protein J6R40_02355 [Clostridia bacterium]|nr:hypothetical protein [Clostridia bacterium]